MNIIDKKEIFNRETKVKFTEITFSYNTISGNAFVEYHQTERSVEIPYIFHIDWNSKKYIYIRDMNVRKSNFTESDRDFVDKWNNTQDTELLTIEEIGEDGRILEKDLYNYIFVSKRNRINNKDGSIVENIDFTFRGTNGHLEEFIDDTGDFKICKCTLLFDHQFAEWGRKSSGEPVACSSFTSKNYKKYKDFLEAFTKAFHYSVPVIRLKKSDYLITIDEREFIK